MKKVLNAIWNEFIYGGHLLALGTVLMIASGCNISKLIFEWPLCLALYFGSFSVYLFDRYKDLKKDSELNSERVLFLSSNKTLIFLYSSVIALLVTIILRFSLVYVSSCILAFGSGYTYNIYFKSLTKKIPLFKNFYVPFSYSLLMLVVSSYYSNWHSNSILLFALFIYLRLFIAVAFYDLKDYSSDLKDGIRTMCSYFSRDKFILWLNILNILSGIPIILGIYLNVFPLYSYMLLVLIPYFFTYSFMSKKSGNLSLYSYIFCDGEYLIWFPLIYLGEKIWH